MFTTPRYQSEQYSGIYGRVLNLDRQFEQISDRAILVTNFDTRDEEDRERLNKLLYTEYQSDTLDTIPSCAEYCGETKGEYNVGVLCEHCGTRVASITDKPIESVLWMEVPKGVDAFIQPLIFTILNNAFSNGRIEWIRWLTDSRYQIPQTVKLQKNKLYHTFKEMGWKRSINNFYQNFDTVMDILFDGPIRFFNSVYTKDIYKQFITENRDRVFCKYLPIPSRHIFITERSGGKETYVDKVIYSAIDAVHTLMSLNTGIKPPTQHVLESRTIKAVTQLSTYYEDFVKNNLSKKPGMFRRQVYGNRLDFSGRAVVSSIAEPHNYDELYFPWGLSVNILKNHITNKLLKKGFKPGDIEEFIDIHTLKYSPLLDEIFKELIDECPYPGIPVLWNRNPTLTRASTQLLYVTKIKPDPNIRTVSFSVLCLVGCNADFDGDEMNIAMLLDHVEHEAFAPLAPHFSVMDLRKPFTVSNNLKIQGPVISTIANWMHEHE